MAQLNFDATQVAPDMGFETIPAGWYNAMIDETEMKPTKDGSGAYLQTRFNVIDGQYAGRKVFIRLNLRNANPVAQEIAYKQLSAIAHAVNVLHVQDSSQLHGLPLKIKVKVRKDKDGQYEDQNEIQAFKNINEQVEMAGAPAQGGAPAGFGGAPAGFGAPQGFQQPAPQQFQQPQAPVQQPQFQQPAAQPWQQPAQQPAPQQPVQQPWQQAPAQQPVQQPAQAPAQAAPVQQPWQQPAAQQPWQQAPAQAPVQQAPVQQAAPQQTHPAQSATPPWAQPQQ